MFNIIPIILILLSLAVIIVIILKKFPILAALDVENMPAEKEAKFKEKIISNRLKRNYYKYYSSLIKLIRPVGSAISSFFSWVYRKLVEYRDNYQKEQNKPIDNDVRLNIFFAEAEDFYKQGKIEDAEKKYIDIISLDSKNIKAFKNLGKLYYARKDFHEAKETFKHAIRLLEKEENSADLSGEIGGEKEKYSQEVKIQLGEIYYNLSLVTMATDNFAEALEAINNSLKFDENSPRYLDIKLEISIMNKDKFSATEAFEKLEKSNPENNKLPELKAKIEELSCLPSEISRTRGPL